MNILILDDESVVLRVMEATVKSVLKDADCAAFSDPDEALDYAGGVKIDIAFLDINMRTISGLTAAKLLKKKYPRINIIFCTGYAEYALDAHDLYCSGYLLKPVTEEKVREAIKNLRYPVEEEKKRVQIRCFGDFEVYCDGMPVEFKYSRTKEMLAYLVDRNGALVTTRAIMAVLFGDESKESYFRNLRSDLNRTFANLGVSDIINMSWNKIGINKSKIDCDYFDYIDGKNNAFMGEYMSQYSFGEYTLGHLNNAKK